jgi:site-specific DNA-methyltransferase (adenine-specific)
VAPAIVTRPRGVVDQKRIVEAFIEIRDGMSADYVVACPDANRRFLDRVRELGVDGNATAINMALLNARKASRLKAQPTKQEYRLPANVESWTFASEWAMRHLQRELVRESDRLIALDEILCNPEYAARFDALVARIKPGFNPLEYRWAALSLRKKGKAKPAPSDLTVGLERQIPLAEAHQDMPAGPGLYLIRAADQPLYVNHTDDLHAQLQRHAEIAGDLLVPSWLLDKVGTPENLSYAYFPKVAPTRLREYRITTIAQYRPWLNLLDAEGAF